MSKPVFGLQGRYKFIKHKVDAEGNVIPGTAKVLLNWFDNLITDVGLDFLGQNVNDNLAYCRLGTGNTAPAFTDVNLVAQVGSSNTAGIGEATGMAVDQTYIYRRVSRRFAAGSVAGLNLAEVGMSQAATGNNIFSRALLRDTGGTPTTITLAADEVLDVVYELRMYINPAEQTVGATIDGVATTVTMRTHAYTSWASVALANIGRGFPVRWYSGNGTVGAAENQLAQTNFGGYNTYSSTLPTIPAYVAGSHVLHFKFDFGLTLANYASGIGAVGVRYGTEPASPQMVYGYEGWMGNYSWGFSPKLNKTASRTATVTVGLTWGRYTP